LALTYAAKRAAKLAPGVGSGTDISIVFRDGIERITKETFEHLASLYEEYKPKAHDLGIEYIGKLHSAIFKVSEQKSLENAEKTDGTDAKTNVSPGDDAAETSRQDEAGIPQAGGAGQDRAE
jgi:hypothetical protein